MIGFCCIVCNFYLLLSWFGFEVNVGLFIKYGLGRILIKVYGYKIYFNDLYFLLKFRLRFF